MADKKDLIAHINTNYNAGLTSSNTSFSKVNKSKNVWWFNIAVKKFEAPVHLLLQIDVGAFWIELPVGFVASLEKTFRIRKDKDAVDLEINAGSNNFLCDVKSGGTGFCVGNFMREEIYLMK